VLEISDEGKKLFYESQGKEYRFPLMQIILFPLKEEISHV